MASQPLLELHLCLQTRFLQVISFGLPSMQVDMELGRLTCTTIHS